MENSISIDTIQRCNLDTDVYSKEWFKKLIDKMSNEDFNKFCKEVCHTREYYDRTCGLIATDRPDLLLTHEDFAFRLDPIDFDSPVNFKKIA